MRGAIKSATSCYREIVVALHCDYVYSGEEISSVSISLQRLGQYSIAAKFWAVYQTYMH